MKHLVIAIGIVAILAMLICLCWYISYRVNLNPKLLFSIDFDDAKRICPKIVSWRENANAWEFVPDDIARTLCDQNRVSVRRVVATYKMKIVGFEPYSFHATKGDIRIEPQQEDKVYVYTYDARYAPAYEGP